MASVQYLEWWPATQPLSPALCSLVEKNHNLEVHVGQTFTPKMITVCQIAIGAVPCFIASILLIFSGVNWVSLVFCFLSFVGVFELTARCSLTIDLKLRMIKLRKVYLFFWIRTRYLSIQDYDALGYTLQKNKELGGFAVTVWAICFEKKSRIFVLYVERFEAEDAVETFLGEFAESIGWRFVGKLN